MKVGKKIFVFLGHEEGPPSITVKVRESHDQEIAISGAEPTGYGSGRPVG